MPGGKWKASRIRAAKLRMPEMKWKEKNMKTKLGITAGALAAITYLTGFFSGYLALIVIVGYVFIMQENDWLKLNTLKALVLTLAFSVLTALVGFIPNILTLINSLFAIWDGSIYGNKVLPAINDIVSFINNCINLIEKVLMLLLALYATKLKTVKIGFIDNMLEKIIVKG